MREFATGATRDDATTKPDYRGFFSPAVLKRFGEYMLGHQIQADGKLRASDNWKKGIPQQEYLSSLLRHVVDLWAQLEALERGAQNPLSEYHIQELLCATLFNAQGLIHERLLGRNVGVQGVTPSHWGPLPSVTVQAQVDPTLFSSDPERYLDVVAPQVTLTWEEWHQQEYNGDTPNPTCDTLGVPCHDKYQTYLKTRGNPK